MSVPVEAAEFISKSC